MDNIFWPENLSFHIYRYFSISLALNPSIYIDIPLYIYRYTSLYLSIYVYLCIYIGSGEKLKRGKSGEKGENRGKGGKMRSEMTTKGGINPIYKPLIVRDLRNRGKIGEKRGNDVVLRSFWGLCGTAHYTLMFKRVKPLKTVILGCFRVFLALFGLILSTPLTLANEK